MHASGKLFKKIVLQLLERKPTFSTLFTLLASSGGRRNSIEFLANIWKTIS